MDAPERQAAVDRLLADPPTPHAMGTGMGVWSTEESCYRLIAELVTPGSRTLETGCGLSTALFSALGADHCCVTPVADEVEEMRRYLQERRIDGGHVTFAVDSSHVVLPRLDGEFDVVLIDGDHGFPMPIVDWFYGAGRLRSGGTVIIDDLQLRAVSVLVYILDRDDRWERLAKTRKWAAFRRITSGPLTGGRWEQPSLTTGLLPTRDALHYGLRKSAGTALRRVKPALRSLRK